MTDLEERVRQALHDPRRELPGWPDPMARVRRAARRQTGGLATMIALLIAGVVVPLAVLPGAGAHPSSVKRPAAHSPSPAAPAPYPSWAAQLGGEVAYQCGDVICLMHPNGTAPRTVPLTGPPQSAQWDPAWSPNGRELSFRGYYGLGDGEYDLYAVSLDDPGCHVTRLTRGLNGTSSSWSPTGRQVAFSVPFGIFVINADGSGLRRLIANTTKYSYGVDGPAWSARNQLAFVQYVPTLHVGEIYALNADGSGITPLTRGTPGFGQPSWSPNGAAIAFVANPDAKSVIDVAKANGTGALRVSPSSWTSYSPTWTPGGKIVFLRQTGVPTPTTDASTSAYIVNPDGTDLRLLYPNLDATQIAWGPTTTAASC
jgi:Tol biopolymer transport system component